MNHRDLTVTNDELLELHQGCRELLEVDDLETLFSFRVSTILETVQPKAKSCQMTRARLDRKYATVEIKNKDGEVVGKRAKDEEADVYKDEVQKLLDQCVKIKVPTLRMSDIYRMREDEGLPIEASTIYNARLVIERDMQLDDEDGEEDSPETNGAAEAEPPKRMTRAERVKQQVAQAAD